MPFHDNRNNRNTIINWLDLLIWNADDFNRKSCCIWQVQTDNTTKERQKPITIIVERSFSNMKKVICFWKLPISLYLLFCFNFMYAKVTAFFLLCKVTVCFLKERKVPRNQQIFEANELFKYTVKKPMENLGCFTVIFRIYHEMWTNLACKIFYYGFTLNPKKLPRFW